MRSMRWAVAIVVLLLAAGPAFAGGSIWDQATAGEGVDKPKRGAPPAGVDEYDRQMWLGDKASLAAVKNRRAHSSASRVKVYIDYAINAYEKAIAADPTQAEPHYRLAWLLHHHYVNDSKERGYQVRDTRVLQRWRTKVIEHWERFIELAPLDPRVESVLMERSLEYTKLDTKHGNERAIGDYAALFERRDPGSFHPRQAGRLASNRAEIHMMLGELPEAIEWYQRALSFQNDDHWAFGLAVAYDRAGYASRARELMATHASRTSLEPFIVWLNGSGPDGRLIFYVPKAEVYYYYGLIHEVLGNYDLAIKRFESFIASGAHPQFHARARHNIKTLQKKLKSGPRPLGVEAWTRTWDLPWQPVVPQP